MGRKQVILGLAALLVASGIYWAWGVTYSAHYHRLVLGEDNAATNADPNPTADITGQNDEYISNSTNGQWSLGSANLLTTGTLGAGAATVTSLTSSGAASCTTLTASSAASCTTLTASGRATVAGLTSSASEDLNDILDLDASDASLYAADITQSATGGALSVTNSGTGNLLLLKDGSTTVLSIADGGSIASAARVTTTDGVSSGTARIVGGRAYCQVAASTAVSATSVETDFDKTYTIPADTLKAQTVVKIRTQGIATATNASDTLTIKVYLGSTAILTTTAVDVTNNDIWYADILVVIRTAGGSGTYVVTGAYQDPGTSGTAQTDAVYLGSTSIDTTATQIIKASATWSSENAGNSCRQDILVVEII